MKKVIKYGLLFLMGVSLISGGMSYGQTPQMNEEKYWDYREKLRNEFMIGIGPDMGMSIPASVRDTVSGILQWTDATMALGEYIGILAMEYHILSKRNSNTTETIEELFYALYALNRLDYHAEPFFGGTASLNGFFIRDDIAEDSLDMTEILEHLNQGLAEQKIIEFQSDYMSQTPRNNEESLDQAILLITGLGMVRKCVPEDVVYVQGKDIQQFQDFETSLYHEAGNIIKRIVNYMKEGDPVTVSLNPDDPNLYGIQGEAWDFIIKNPVSYEPVLRGENAFLLSKGFTSAKFHLTEQLSLTIDLEMDTIADTLFKAFEMFIIPNDQDFKVINLNAMSNYWPDGLQEDTSNTEYNARVLGPRSQFQGYEWVPMLHQLVFEGENNYLMSGVPPDTLFYDDPEGYYSYLLDLAPAEGPYNYGEGIYPSWEWSSTSRTIQPGRRGETGNGFPGNYDGLDYMLYYNLFTLLYSRPVNVEETEMDKLNIYPNPFREILRIGNISSGKYFIFDIKGRIIMQGGVTEKGSIGVGELPPGMYIIKISDNYNNNYTSKIIKHNF